MQPRLESTAAAQTGSIAFGARVLRNLAAQDWIIAFYLLGLFIAVARGEGPGRTGAFTSLLADSVMVGAGMIVTRGGIIKGAPAAIVYRASIFLALLLSYLQMREILPAVTTRSLDAEIYAFDLRWLHYEPSVAWDKYVSYGTTEWFAFFYFGYFFLLGMHIFPFMLFGGSGRLLHHFSLGIFIQFCTSHTLYMVVPGWGPYHHLTFDHALTGGTFWSLVLQTVHAGSAMKDIFPSLHTGAPVFITLFSFIHRAHKPFKYTWPIMAFCVTQIVIATMFLRWHYLIDIIAGASLSCVSAFGGLAIVKWEERRRAAVGATPVFGEAPLAALARRFGAG
jgi:hypothetical protein